MFFRIFLVIFIAINSLSVLANTIDPDRLEIKISKLNDNHKYEIAITELTEIINNSESTHYDKYNAYLQKYLTYKRLYNYSAAADNLEKASKEGELSDRKAEVEIRVLVEKVFINFDLQKNDEVNKIISLIKKENLGLLNPETNAFYLSVLAVINTKAEDYNKAEQNFDKAIRILESVNPKHLPNIYRKKIDLYRKMKQPEKAIGAFKTGLFYAKKYKVDIYIIVMYEAITSYYVANEDYKNALFYQNKVSEKRTKYDAANKSGDLNILEKRLLKQKIDLELKKRKKISVYSCQYYWHY